MEIVLATNNEHKLQEVNAICKSFDLDVKFILPPKEFNPVEDGMSFEENSYIKAKAANLLTHKYTLADDSGLCVKALNGAPGLYSNRFAGTQQEKIDKILKLLEDKDDRSAKFVCAMTLLDENGNVKFTAKGECHGAIVKEQKGVNGFGYDPVFLPEGKTLTMAELSEEEKNKISHRGNALNQVINFLKTLDK